MMIAIFEYMDRIVDMVRPRKLLYMAIGKFKAAFVVYALLFIFILFV